MNPTELAALSALGPVALWLLLVGFFSPLAIAVIQQSHWPVRTQSIVAFCFYLVVAAVTAALQGIFTTTGIIVSVLVIFVTAGNSYKLLWQPTGVAPAIMKATLLSDPAPDLHLHGRHTL